ncbi:hypothetical protein RT717_17710 [Imperialibacter roseus]|uniref:Uncharacterized protein n=1 Tax=Imperialibacter roseus TaxID=1324217 RepID=A0ABZ0IIQ3_9BACT|nr:hypothetical protein [Imperialibacter roseus]WOK04922.1 hypothetical protein RT717_17710 [Imperialibacter roseus]
MFGLTKRIPIYIRIFRDKIEAKRLDNSQRVALLTDPPISNNRLLLANYDSLLTDLRVIVNMLNRSMLVNKYKFIFQLVDDDLTDVSQIEKMCLNDAGLACGANWVYILDHSEELGDAELSKILTAR